MSFCHSWSLWLCASFINHYFSLITTNAPTLKLCTYVLLPLHIQDTFVQIFYKELCARVANTIRSIASKPREDQKQFHDQKPIQIRHYSNLIVVVWVLCCNAKTINFQDICIGTIKIYSVTFYKSIMIKYSFRFINNSY